MIDIRIDLIPHGFQSNRRNIASIQIVNNGTGGVKTGNYIIRFFSENNELLWATNINNYKRTEQTVFPLMYLALEKYIKEVEQIKGEPK